MNQVFQKDYLGCIECHPQSLIKGEENKCSTDIFSCVHATLYVTMSVRRLVRRSVRNHFASLHFFWHLELKGDQI